MSVVADPEAHTETGMVLLANIPFFSDLAGFKEKASIFLFIVNKFTNMAESKLLTEASCAAGPESADSFEAKGVSFGVTMMRMPCPPRRVEGLSSKRWRENYLLVLKKPSSEGVEEGSRIHLAWMAQAKQLEARACSQIRDNLSQSINVQKTLGKRSGGQEVIKKYYLKMPPVRICSPDYTPAENPQLHD